MDKTSLPWGTNRIRATFLDKADNPALIHGTGFWINVDDHLREFAWVTNRHNLVAGLKNESHTKRFDFQIELRKIPKDRKNPTQLSLLAATEFFAIDEAKSRIYSDGPSDCALIYPVVFQNLQSDYQPFASFRLSDLADEHFFNARLQMTDPCHFIGFPMYELQGSADSGKPKKIGWWDHTYNAPISRSASIASHPATYTGFTHPMIDASDIVLVSGLSVWGSSGSPVISEQKGIGTDVPWETESRFIKEIPKSIGPGSFETYASPNVKYLFADENFVPSKLIGIMTGHCKTEVEGKLEHSGLSYFTRSLSIIKLMEQAGFRRNQVGFWLYPSGKNQNNPA